MRFSMPHYPCDFEIPDDWLMEAGMVGFTATEAAFHSDASAVFVPLRTIEPVPRFVSHPKDWRGFDRARLIRLFKGFVSRDEIEPVPLFELPTKQFGTFSTASVNNAGLSVGEPLPVYPQLRTFSASVAVSRRYQ